MNHNFVPSSVYPGNPNGINYKIKQTCRFPKIVGEMSLIFVDDGDIIYLDFISVNNNYRDLGIGTEILLKLIDFGKKFGSKKILLVVDADNTKAQSLYQRLGFKFLTEIDDEFFCYRMEYIL